MSDFDDVAYIIGNGTSRKNFDLNLLKGKGTSFGCNAIYRDWEPDYLVAIDDLIINEIRKSISLKETNITEQRFIVPPWTECYEDPRYSRTQRRSNAGMNAMNEAIRFDNKQLICLGFDFMIMDPKQATSNVYEGTNAYGPETHATYEDSVNRIKYMNWYAHHNNDIQFIFVFDGADLNKRYVTASNISTMTYSDLTQALSAS